MTSTREDLASNLSGDFIAAAIARHQALHSVCFNNSSADFQSLRCKSSPHYNAPEQGSAGGPKEKKKASPPELLN